MRTSTAQDHFKHQYALVRQLYQMEQMLPIFRMSLAQQAAWKSPAHACWQARNARPTEAATPAQRLADYRALARAMSQGEVRLRWQTAHWHYRRSVRYQGRFDSVNWAELRQRTVTFCD